MPYRTIAYVVLLSFGVAVFSAYAMGRIHQWFNNGAKRERAFRGGYVKASCSMLDLADSSRALADEPTSDGSSEVGCGRRRLILRLRPDRIRIPAARGRQGIHRR